MYTGRVDAFLGIDVGTSATKAIVCDERAGLLGGASADHSLSRPRPGWSEQDPQQWWSATVQAARAAVDAARISPDSVRAVGLSGQMHGSVLLSRQNLSTGGREAAPLRPALLWNDQRTAAECREIEHAAGGRAALVRMVGNAALTGFTLPKLLWVRKNEPDIWRSVAAFCLPKDYIGLRLTGELATDVGDASGTLLFDVARRAWHEGMCRTMSIDPAILPPALESSLPTGPLSPWAAQQIGLRAGIPVVVGSGDNMTGAVGSGVVEPGIVAATLGTSGVIIAHSDSPAIDLPANSAEPPGRTHTMCAATGGGSGGATGKGAAGRGGWCITGCMLSAAGSLKWCRDTLFPGVPYDQLMAEAATALPGSGGLVFLPYLTGERCPHPDPDARGAWIGLTSRHTRAHLVRAVIEGVSFAMGEIFQIVRGLGIAARSVRISGGGAKSALWRQIQADVYSCPVVVTNSQEGPALGAAILAGVGVGRWPGVAQACREVIREVEVTHPSADGPAAYLEPRRVFGRLYGDLAQRFAELSRMDE
jgi:xylulokinase